MTSTQPDPETPKRRKRGTRAKPKGDDSVSLATGHIIGPDGKVRRSSQMQQRVRAARYAECGVSVGYFDIDITKLKQQAGFARSLRIPPLKDKPVAIAAVASKVSQLRRAMAAYAIRATMDDGGDARMISLSAVVDDSFDAERRRETMAEIRSLDTLVLECENPLNSRAYPGVLTEILSVRASRSGSTLYLFDSPLTVPAYGVSAVEYFESTEVVWINHGSK